MVWICLQCGDEGISSALVYCDKCLNCTIHKYCLDELPLLLNEPVHWVCEDCEDKMPIQSILHKTSKPVQANSSNFFNDSSQLPIDTNDIENDICGPIQSILHKTSKPVQANHSNLFNDSSQLPIDTNDIENDICGRAQPVIDPIWRGNFGCLNEKRDTIEGLVAHSSSKACQKVCEEARLLPSLLCLEMLPKSNVWPKCFHGSDPSDDSIGLYFFPADKRYERVFDDLVDDLICRELAMRANSENAELLVFTSTELQKLYWSCSMCHL
ncbi:hypothetical protein LguiA_004293 [Lonicera macranthoides]